MICGDVSGSTEVSTVVSRAASAAWHEGGDADLGASVAAAWSQADRAVARELCGYLDAPGAFDLCPPAMVATALALRGSTLVVAWAGRQLTVVVRGGGAAVVATPHSMVWELDARGDLAGVDANERTRFANNDVSLRCLGAHGPSTPGNAPEQLPPFELVAGDTLVLCSSDASSHLVVDDFVVAAREPIASLAQTIADLARVRGALRATVTAARWQG